MDETIKQKAVELWNRKFPRAPRTVDDLHAVWTGKGRQQKIWFLRGRQRLGYVFVQPSGDDTLISLAGPYAEPDFALEQGELSEGEDE